MAIKILSIFEEKSNGFHDKNNIYSHSISGIIRIRWHNLRLQICLWINKISIPSEKYAVE